MLALAIFWTHDSAVLLRCCYKKWWEI